MHGHLPGSVILLVALLCAGLPAEEALGPGRHLDLKIPGKREAWSWNAYIPKQYAEPGQAPLPALFLSAPKCNPGLGGLESWADSRGVIIIGINGTANGQTFDTIHLIQDATYADVLLRVRMHPFLRFASGGSGGGRMSHHLAMRHPNEFAGVFMMIMAESPPLPKHMAVGYFLGRNDESVPLQSAMPDVEATRSNGNIVRLEIGPGGHEGPPTATRIAFFDWLVAVARLTHPRISDKERSEYLAALKTRLEGEPADAAEATSRIAECAALLSIPVVAKSPVGQVCAKAWFRLASAEAGKESDPWKKHGLLLAMAESPTFALLDTASRTGITTQLTALRKDQPVKDEWAALSAYRGIQADEAKAGNAKGRLTELVNSYSALAKRFPATVSGAAAKLDAERVAARLAAK